MPDNIRVRKSKSFQSDNSSVSPATTSVTGSVERRNSAASRGPPPKGPYTAPFWVAFGALAIVRVLSALYANIADCDEVYNYWEPTHYLQYGYGMQTWEYSPEYSIRSWAYIFPQVVVGKILEYAIGDNDKIKIFYGIRIFFSLLSAFCEAKFYRAVLDQLGNRVGRYMFIMLLTGAGMWNAATAYLPSTFAMYTTMLAFSYALGPVSSKNTKRPYRAIGFFAFGALYAWPFSAVVGLPLVFEEIFVRGTETSKVLSKNINWRAQRVKRVLGATFSGLLILIPVVAFDYFFYQKFTVVPLNIILYNVFGGSERGPNLYGTEPWTYYFINGFLNFNILYIMAILSLPALVITFFVDNGRIASASPTDKNYPYIIVLLRLIPLYLWLSIFCLIPHKEERFLYVVYPLVCLNAAVCLFLARGWVDRFLFEVQILNKARNRRKQMLTGLTSVIILVSVVISASRITALYQHYYAPVTIYKHFYYEEIPSQELTNVDDNKEINLCLGKEWYRFPSHYFLPHGVRLRFIESDFLGLLPKYFPEAPTISEHEGPNYLNMIPPGTWQLPSGFNDRNLQNPDHSDSNTDKCDYLIDVDFESTQTSPREPRYAQQTDDWSRIICVPFLNANQSNRFARAFHLPNWLLEKWSRFAPSRINPKGDLLRWGEYCLLKKVEKKIEIPEVPEVIVVPEEIPKESSFFNLWGYLS
ncbi:hypothetical protein G9A89_019727 [Geosiphon pyriformis]|nr:hypothetical protein G9A89_019727 [Geosiphon pyriformis]